MTHLLLVLALGFPQEKPGVPEKGKVLERVTVDRVVVTGRVIDRFANPIPGLVAGNFRLRVDGRGAAIETVEWIPGRRQPEEKQVPAETPSGTAKETAVAAPPPLVSRLTGVPWQAG